MPQDQLPATERSGPPPEQTEAVLAPILARLGTVALVALPAILTVYLAFHSGGFFPGPPGLVAVVLAQILVLRTTLAERPLAGYRGRLAIAAGAFALFALWGLSSSLWSHAGWRALAGFDRSLMYLLVLVLFGSAAWTMRSARYMLWALTLGIVAVCAAGLASRLLPDLLPTPANVANERLSYPLTYWNSLGLVAALGVIFCLGLASDERSPRAIRALGAAALPLVATTLFFTFSRGAIASGVVGLLVFVVIARPRGLLSAAVVVLPTTAVALVTAYDAALLATPDPTTAAAARQGHHVALIVVLCMGAAALVRLGLTRADSHLHRLPVLSPRRKRLAIGAGITGLVLAGILGGLDHRISRTFDQFLNKPTLSASTDFRTRLTDASNSERLAHWQVALDAFDGAPLKGTGLGTYERQWAQHRSADFLVVNAHSLYLETMSETGLVGIVLLLVALGAIFWGFARRARGPGRVLYGTVLGGGAAWALENGVDWAWQMPATTVWLFALGGVALGARGEANRSSVPLGNGWRLALSVGWLMAAATPLLVVLSEGHHKASVRAFNNHQCATASRQALSTISTLRVRPEPYELLAYCDMEAGYGNEAVAAMRAADMRDPYNWELQYGLALALASSGRDPRAALDEAIRLNPREKLLRQFVGGLESASPATRQAAAQRARVAAVASPDISLGYI